MIPGNTGTIARTCVGTETYLHLIKPLGFSLSDKYLKRSGLDYWPHLNYSVYNSWGNFLEDQRPQIKDLFFIETTTTKSFWSAEFSKNSYIILGKETSGIPQPILEQYPDRIFQIPMTGATRSLNLSNASSIVLYEALRQQNYHI